MIASNNPRIWEHESRKDLGYFIGGGITTALPNDWRWNKGGVIPLPEEVRKYEITNIWPYLVNIFTFLCYWLIATVYIAAPYYLLNAANGFNEFDNLSTQKKLFIETLSKVPLAGIRTLHQFANSN